MLLFSRKTNVHDVLSHTAWMHLLATTFKGKELPEKLATYYAGKYAIALWFDHGQPGYSVLQSIAGIWAVLGAEIGSPNAKTLLHLYKIPQGNAEHLCRQITMAAPSYPHHAWFNPI